MDEEPLTVIVVDDDESVRRAIGRLLKSSGYQVLTFESAEELLQSIKHRDKVCLLLDIRLPSMSGVDLYVRLASSGVQYPVIFMTAHEHVLWRDQAEKLGEIAFLENPLLSSRCSTPLPLFGRQGGDKCNFCRGWRLQRLSRGRGSTAWRRAAP